MELEIRPEPPEAVRRVIEAAVVAARDEDEPPAWWRAGIEESLGDERD